jgi:hypothetical protein
VTLLSVLNTTFSLKEKAVGAAPATVFHLSTNYQLPLTNHQ